MVRTIIFFLISLFLGSNLNAQFFKEYAPKNAGEIQLALEKINTLGSALYIAAHPDDENTRLITYLTNHMNVRTGYISLTRGDGGQNLIGTEKGPEMGLLRTHELMEARKKDEGLQFFTRANDFGYSKTAEETFRIWDKEKVLADLVWVIRKFQPDVLITRFPPEKYNYPTHGHHSASAELAEEAFEAAGDPDKFPEQLEYVTVWKPKRLLWNTSTWFYRRTGTELDTAEKISVNVGKYNPILGKSYTEIAAESRSQHKSQGFGALSTRGTEIEYLEIVKGNKGRKIFSGINTSWSRINGGEKVSKHIDNARAIFNPAHPELIIPSLLKAYKELQKLEDSYWKTVKEQEIEYLIAASNGMWIEAFAETPMAAPGTEVTINTVVNRRGPYDIRLKTVEFPFDQLSIDITEPLPEDQNLEHSKQILIPEGTEPTRQFWLMNDTENPGMYKVDEPELFGLPLGPSPMNIRYVFEVDGITFSISREIDHKWRDPVHGEMHRPFVITPPATVQLRDKVIIFPGKTTRTVMMTLVSHKDNMEGKLEVTAGKNWKITPESVPFSFSKAGEEKKVEFTITPPESSENDVVYLTPRIISGNKTWNLSLVTIRHPHIPEIVTMPEAKAKLVRLNVKTGNEKIGYIMGAGDEIPESLRQLGYQVTLINPDEFTGTNLNNYDVIILGIRAFNTNEWLATKKDRLMQYVKAGGNLIVQYNTSYGLAIENPGPYPFEISRDRVTVENAEVKILEKKHPIFNTPNIISDKDFEGWVQERGLYFAGEWDEKYTPLLESNDPGEDPVKGGLLVTEYGKGTFIYTGYSFFRQLPAGVPGAYRLFANLISFRKK